MSIGIESTAGEKEKKTFITLISSNITRKQIVIGKIGSTSFFGLISATLTIIGLILGAFVSSKILKDTKMIKLSFENGITLFVILVISAVIISSLIIILGVIAKTMKEANSYIMPLYIAVIFAGILSTYLNKNNLIWALIPIINSSLIIKSLFWDKANVLFILLSLATSILLIFVLIRVCIKLFKSEEKTVL